MADLTYKTTGLFTIFFADTKAGEKAYAQLAEQTEGTGKIFTAHLKATITQLRKAGYTVAKAPENNVTLEDMFDGLEELGL